MIKNAHHPIASYAIVVHSLIIKTRLLNLLVSNMFKVWLGVLTSQTYLDLSFIIFRKTGMKKTCYTVPLLLIRNRKVCWSRSTERIWNRHAMRRSDLFGLPDVFFEQGIPSFRMKPQWGRTMSSGYSLPVVSNPSIALTCALLQFSQVYKKTAAGKLGDMSLKVTEQEKEFAGKAAQYQREMKHLQRMLQDKQETLDEVLQQKRQVSQSLKYTSSICLVKGR